MTRKARYLRRCALLLAGIAALLPAPAPAGAADAALTTVEHVDLERYLGQWHEIARLPAWFQRKCVGDTTATYSRADDGSIEVLNRCRTREGFDEARGVARVVDERSNARLEVSFFSLLGWRPVWGDYWIIALAPDYRWVVVGEPGRRYGWLLARSAELDAPTRAAIDTLIAAQGYDPAAFLPTPQATAPP